jgi:hypothetical protein
MAGVLRVEGILLHPNPGWCVANSVLKVTAQAKAAKGSAH